MVTFVARGYHLGQVYHTDNLNNQPSQHRPSMGMYSNLTKAVCTHSNLAGFRWEGGEFVSLYFL